jgi:hypothetical protein
MSALIPDSGGFLLGGRTLLRNAKSSPDILSAVSEFGSDENRINEGLNLLMETEDLILKQKKEYGERF